MGGREKQLIHSRLKENSNGDMVMHHTIKLSSTGSSTIIHQVDKVIKAIYETKAGEFLKDLTSEVEKYLDKKKGILQLPEICTIIANMDQTDGCMLLHFTTIENEEMVVCGDSLKINDVSAISKAWYGDSYSEWSLDVGKDVTNIVRSLINKNNQVFLDNSREEKFEQLFGKPNGTNPCVLIVHYYTKFDIIGERMMLTPADFVADENATAVEDEKTIDLQKKEAEVEEEVEEEDYVDEEFEEDEEEGYGDEEFEGEEEVCTNAELEESTEQDKIAEEKAATKIQAHWKGHQVRKTQEEEKAATQIQARWKGHQDRKKVAEMKKEKEEEINAATKIQANWKGHKARQEVNQMKEENEAATKIQARWKGHQTRQSLKENATVEVEQENNTNSDTNIKEDNEDNVETNISKENNKENVETEIIAEDSNKENIGIET